MLRKSPRALLGAIIVLTTAVLAGCAPGNSPTTPTPTVSASASSSAAPLPTVTSPPVASTFPCTQPAPTGAAPTADELENYQAVIVSANTQPMSTHACDTVTFIISGSECCGPLDRDNALVQWGDWLGMKSDWNFSPDPALVAEWRTHAYAQYVPEGALIAVSDTDGVMTSVIFDGNIITGLFMASLEEMLY